jgi:LemA protein
MSQLSIIIAVVVIAALLIFLMIAIFNKFVKNRNLVQDAWSNIDVALKRRYDLIPNLVETVKGYAAHEKDTLEKVIQARNAAMAVPPDDISGQIKAENALQQTLRSIFALSEAYPDLKANANFIDLQQKLNEIEENLERSRRYYNGSVRQNNTYGESFPGVLFAGLLKYKHFDFFETTGEERENVKVDFS